MCDGFIPPAFGPGLHKNCVGQGKYPQNTYICRRDFETVETAGKYTTL